MWELGSRSDTAWEEQRVMGPMQKERLRPLTVAEQRELKRLIKASSARLDRVRRAMAVLAVAAGGCH